MLPKLLFLPPLLRLHLRSRLQQQRSERHVPVPVPTEVKPQSQRRRQPADRREHSRRRREVSAAVNPGWDGGGGGGEGGAGGRGGDGGDGEGAGASGGDDGGLGVPEEPLDGLAVRAVAELSCQLEDASGAERRHPHAPPPAVHLRVPVAADFPGGYQLVGSFWGGDRSGGGGGGGWEMRLGLGWWVLGGWVVGVGDHLGTHGLREREIF